MGFINFLPAIVASMIRRNSVIKTSHQDIVNDLNKSRPKTHNYTMEFDPYTDTDSPSTCNTTTSASYEKDTTEEKSEAVKEDQSEQGAWRF